MLKATRQELQESIKELSAYRDRLLNEVLKIGKKLRLPQQKIDLTIQEHSELKQVEKILKELQTELATKGT